LGAAAHKSRKLTVFFCVLSEAFFSGFVWRSSCIEKGRKGKKEAASGAFFLWRNETVKQKQLKLGKSPKFRNAQEGPTGKEAAEKAARPGQHRGVKRGPLQEKNSIRTASGSKEPGSKATAKVR